MVPSGARAAVHGGAVGEAHDLNQVEPFVAHALGDLRDDIGADAIRDLVIFRSTTLEDVACGLAEHEHLVGDWREGLGFGFLDLLLRTDQWQQHERCEHEHDHQERTVDEWNEEHVRFVVIASLP